jgi:hypothetical protein
VGLVACNGMIFISSFHKTSRLVQNYSTRSCTENIFFAVKYEIRPWIPPMISQQKPSVTRRWDHCATGLSRFVCVLHQHTEPRWVIICARYDWKTERRGEIVRNFGLGYRPDDKDVTAFPLPLQALSHNSTLKYTMTTSFQICHNSSLIIVRLFDED